MLMPVTVDTQYPTAILINYEGAWTWQEYREAHQIVSELLDELTAPIDVITNVENSKIPKDMLTGFRRDAMQWHANVRLVIVLGASVYIHTMYRLFVGVYPRTKRRVLLVRTLDEALAISREPDLDKIQAR